MSLLDLFLHDHPCPLQPQPTVNSSKSLSKKGGGLLTTRDSSQFFISSGCTKVKSRAPCWSGALETTRRDWREGQASGNFTGDSGLPHHTVAKNRNRSRSRSRSNNKSRSRGRHNYFNSNFITNPMLVCDIYQQAAL